MLFGFSIIAAAEERYDYRTDTRSFCEKIAELNIDLESSAVSGRKRAQPTMVLFQTRTVPLDFTDAGFEPVCVVYGPRGFSVLICTNPGTAVSWLLQQDGVLYAEIDSEVSGCSEGETEPSVAFQSWGATAAGFGDYWSYAGNWGSGSCTVAVVDSGVYRHSLINPKIRSLGHDYIDNDNDPTNDLHGHGTRVAGIVADCTRELPVYIFPIRVLDADANGKTSNVISAVLEATDAHVNVINLSLSTFSQSELLESAIRSAISSGIIVVAAAGNYACDASEVTPACMTDAGIIVVGSAEADGSRSSFSNYGASVDLYFYGRSISSCSRSGGYVSDTGTSMAAPHISALCAMMKLVHPSLSAGNMVSRMICTYGNGINVLNAAAMVPQSLGFYLHSINLRTGESLQLPVSASPASSRETIQYLISDETLIEVSEGCLTAKGAGQTEITVHCAGFEDSLIHVTVSDGDSRMITLPSDLRMIEEAAFEGISADHVIIPSEVQAINDHAFDGGSIRFVTAPDSVSEIGDNSFSGAVILCREGSSVYEYAINHQLQYVVNN